MTPEMLVKLVKHTKPEMNYACQYCKKAFVKESTLLKHSCEQRRRHQQRDKPHVRIAFQAFLKEYPGQKTYEDFVTCSFYGAFVKFGQYCVDTGVLNPLMYITWLIKKQKRIDGGWTRDSNYTEYLIEYLRLESVQDALTRAIEYSIDWGESHNQPSHDVLRFNGNEARLLVDITRGQISPWVLYASESGQKFLSELDSTQQAMIWDYIDVDIWSKIIRNSPSDFNFAQDILKKAGW